MVRKYEKKPQKGNQGRATRCGDGLGTNNANKHSGKRRRRRMPQRTAIELERRATGSRRERERG